MFKDFYKLDFEHDKSYCNGDQSTRVFNKYVMTLCDFDINKIVSISKTKTFDVGLFIENNNEQSFDGKYSMLYCEVLFDGFEKPINISGTNKQIHKIIKE